MSEEYYLIRIYGDVEPEIVGQYKNDSERLQRAKAIHTEDKKDGIYRLDIVDGHPIVGCFTEFEVDPDC